MMPAPTTYKCDRGHEFYSYATTLRTTCAYPNCDAEPVPVTGPFARKKERSK